MKKKLIAPAVASLLVMVFMCASLLAPSAVFAGDAEDLQDLKQRIKALEEKSAAGAAAEKKADEKTVDYGGFIRVRNHTSNFTTFGAGQFLPLDKGVANADKTANYFEQRARLYISPKISDYVSGTFAFEFDSRFGDSAYGVGRNAGGGLGTDQTNIETKNIMFNVKVPYTNLSAALGIQNIADPYGGILLGWADTGGITLNYKAAENLDTLFGYYRFWQPTARIKKSVAADFLRGEAAYVPSKDLNLGFNLYALLDRTGVDATAADPGVLGGPAVGSTSNGFAPLAYNASTGNESLVGNTQYRMNLFMPGVNFKYKISDYTLDGFFIYEGGKFTSGTAGISNVTISSYAANLGLAGKLGPVSAKLSGLYVSGDNSSTNASIGIKKGGFYTPGSYSLAGAWMGLTGMKILFPDIDATNQDQYLVYDVTNEFEQKPLGITAIMLTGNVPLSPKTKLEAGIGSLASAEKRVVNNKSYMATEVNVGVDHALYKNVNVGVVGAYAWVGDFYKVTDAQAAAFNATKSGTGVGANNNPSDMWRIYFRANYAF